MMNPALLTPAGREAVASGRLLSHIHLRRRGNAYRLFADTEPVTVELPAEVAAVTAVTARELCGVVPEKWFLGEVIASAVEG